MANTRIILVGWNLSEWNNLHIASNKENKSFSVITKILQMYSCQYQLKYTHKAHTPYIQVIVFVTTNFADKCIRSTVIIEVTTYLIVLLVCSQQSIIWYMVRYLI